MKLNTLIHSLLGLSLVGSLATAQSFNVDIEGGLGTPLGTEPGAAGQQGTWNSLVWGPSGLPSQTLVDLNGAASLVSVSSGTVGATFNSACTVPALYDGISGTNAGGQTLLFSGLQSGTYQVYTYAALPGTISDTVATVAPSTDAPQLITADCLTGGALHDKGTTYAVQTSVLPAGSALSVNVDSLLGVGGPWVISAVQIVFVAPGSVGTNYCVGNPNSVGSGAGISATSSTSAGNPTAVSIGANNLTLACDGLPSGQPLIFMHGDAQLNLAFGNGRRCVGGTVIRWAPMSTGSGSVTMPVDFNNLPVGAAFAAGDTFYFQTWYRDPAGGGAFFNLSDGLDLDFGL